MMDNFARRVVEENSGSREVEKVFSGAAAPARSLDRNLGNPTAWTYRRCNRCQRIPAVPTNRAVETFEDRCATDNARNRENEIEYRIDHLRRGSARGTVSISLRIWMMMNDGQPTINLFEQEDTAEIVSEGQR